MRYVRVELPLAECRATADALREVADEVLSSAVKMSAEGRHLEYVQCYKLYRLLDNSHTRITAQLLEFNQ